MKLLGDIQTGLDMVLLKAKTHQNLVVKYLTAEVLC